MVLAFGLNRRKGASIGPVHGALAVWDKRAPMRSTYTSSTSPFELKWVTHEHDIAGKTPGLPIDFGKERLSDLLTLRGNID